MAQSKKPQRGLGRGLSALMSDAGLNTDNVEAVKDVKGAPGPRKSSQDDLISPDRKSGNSVSAISIDQIIRNPDQPRRYFDPEKLEDLTRSIADKGVLQPILLRPIPRKPSHVKPLYQIVAGERRWQASVKAGLTQMPALVRELSDRDVLEIGVVENVQRADLNPIEEALAYRALVDQFNRTQQEISNAIGKSRPYIANSLRLLSLPERAQVFLQEGKITTGHARAIIAAPDPVALAENIVDKGLSVREAEDWVRRMKKQGAGPGKVPAIKTADIRKVETDLRDALGLAIDLRHKSPGGEVRIKYKTGDQLEEIIRRLKD